MLISAAAITAGGASLGYIGLRPRKKGKLIDLLAPKPLLSSAKAQTMSQVNELYGQVRDQWSQTQAQIVAWAAAETWLAPTHRHATKPLYPLVSPWADPPIKVINNAQAPHQDKAQATTGVAQTQLRIYLYYLGYYWRPYWKWGVAAFVFFSAFSFYLVGYSVVLKLLLDSIAVAQSATILAILLKLLAILPVAIAFTLLGVYLSSRLTSRIAKDIRYDLLAHIQSLPVDYFKQHSLGDTLSLFSADMTKLQEGLGEQLIQLASRSFAILLYLSFMFWMAWPLALLVLLTLPVTTYTLKRFSPNVGLLNRQLRQRKAMTLNATQEALRAQPMVKSFGLHQFLQEAYVNELKKLEAANTSARYTMVASFYYSLFLISVVENSALGLGILLAIGGLIPVGTLVAFQILMMSLRREFNLSMLNATVVVESAACIERLHQLFQTQTEIADHATAHELTSMRHGICFENVAFSYTGTEPQLHDINLTIEAGQLIAFVGPSGAGKSTILNLLLRFYDVASGRITIDGYDVREVTQASLRRHFGVVLQETFLFNTTLLNNIRVVCPQASKAQVMAAAKAAELHDFIMSLPDGYESNVGEGGGKLSGGQKQRVAIARALLCNADILLLDEATSSLDAETAAAINSTIQKIAQERTVIAITHALSSVVQADKIYVLDQGSLVQAGTHTELLAAGGLYAQLWHTQNHGAQLLTVRQ